MDDLNCKYNGDHLTYEPRGIVAAEYRVFQTSGYWSAQIYWRHDGLPFILNEFFRIEQGDKLVVFPVGTHSLEQAAKFINFRIADVYHYVTNRARTGAKLPTFDLRKWRLGPYPGSSPIDPSPGFGRSDLRDTG